MLSIIELFEKFGPVFILIIVISVFILYEYHRLNIFKNESFKLNIALGSPFIPKLYRQLTPDERKKLNLLNYLNDYFNIKQLYKYAILIIFFIYISFKKNFYILLVIPAIMVFCLIWYLFRIEEKLYLDKITPVIKLTGPLNFFYIENNKSRNSLLYFAVADEKFAINRNSMLAKEILSIDNKNLVEIEYTYFSKTILEIKIFKKNKTAMS